MIKYDFTEFYFLYHLNRFNKNKINPTESEPFQVA